MTDQIVIKVILVVVFLVFAFVLIKPGKSARTQALRKIAMILFFAAAVTTVVFPSLINHLANAVGVGRGADLLLYALIIVFFGTNIAAARHRASHDQQITQLARNLALANPLQPLGAGSSETK